MTCDLLNNTYINVVNGYNCLYSTVCNLTDQLFLNLHDPVPVIFYITGNRFSEVKFLQLLNTLKLCMHILQKLRDEHMQVLKKEICAFSNQLTGSYYCPVTSYRSWVGFYTFI